VSRDGAKVWYSKLNRTAGVLIVIICGALYLAIEAFPDSTDPASLGPSIVGFVGLSLPAWLLFVHPQVCATDEHFVIRNPLFETIIPWQFVQHIGGTGKELEVEADGRSYRVWGLENANITVMLSRSGSVQRVAMEINDFASRRARNGTRGERITRRVKLPSIWLFVAFLAVIIVGILLNKIG